MQLIILLLIIDILVLVICEELMTFLNVVEHEYKWKKKRDMHIKDYIW